MDHLHARQDVSGRVGGGLRRAVRTLVTDAFSERVWSPSLSDLEEEKVTMRGHGDDDGCKVSYRLGATNKLGCWWQLQLAGLLNTLRAI